jgi:HEAT repeat protein
MSENQIQPQLTIEPLIASLKDADLQVRSFAAKALAMFP